MCISKSYSRGDTFRQLPIAFAELAIAFAEFQMAIAFAQISNGNWQSIFRIAGESKYYFIGCNGRFGNAKFVQVRL